MNEFDKAQAALALWLGALMGCENQEPAPNRVMLYCQNQHGEHFTVTYAQLIALAGLTP